MGKPLTRRSHAPQWLLFPRTMMRTEGLGAIRGYQEQARESCLGPAVLFSKASGYTQRSGSMRNDPGQNTRSSAVPLPPRLPLAL